MSDLRERFRVLDRLDTPDVWEEAARRRPGTRRVSPGPRRGLTLTVAVVVALAGIAVALRAFDTDHGRNRTPVQEQTPPATAKANGPIYFRIGGGDGPSWVSAVQPDGTDVRVVFPPDSPIHYDRISFSPDGSRIAFDNFLADEYGIETANPDGTDVVRLTRGVNESWPSWSPDGSKIVFSSTRHDPSIDECTPGTDALCPTDIYVMDADGSHIERLTTDAAPEFAPAWSPDGSRVAFVRADRGHSAVFTMAPDGSEIRRISDTDGHPDARPTWSPDGSKLAFGEGDAIVISNADGSGATSVFADGVMFVGDPVWSPDGVRIAFVEQSEEGTDTAIYSITPDGSDRRRLAGAPFGYGVAGDIAWQPLTPAAVSPEPSPSSSAPTQSEAPTPTPPSPSGAGADEGVLGFGLDKPAPGPGFVTVSHLVEIGLDGTVVQDVTPETDASFWAPAWSRDGALIAARRVGPIQGGRREDGIWVMDADGSGLREVHARQGNENVMEIQWSPDGTRIAYVVESGSGSEADFVDQLFVMGADGSNVTALTPADFQVWDFSWSPDGTRIVLTHQFLRTKDRFGYDLYVMNADGSGLEQLTNGGRSRTPAWSPDGTRIAFAGYEPDVGFMHGDVYVMNADGTGTVRLTTDPGTEDGPVWSPDASRIAFVELPDGDGSACSIEVMDRDGTGRQTIADKDALGACPGRLSWVPAPAE
jgi:Tol biopolymer transport system component